MGYGLNPSNANCYDGTTCLINKLDIHDENLLHIAEEEIVLAKLTLLGNTPIKGKFDFTHYKAIHKFLFEDLYDWAGTVRNVNILKKRTNFTDFKDIERLSTLCLNKIRCGYLDDLSFDDFATRIAELYHDINILHPFREGNGRTQRAFFTQLIREYNYDINFSNVDTDYLMLATIQAASGVMDMLIDFFKESISSPNMNFDITL